ncbi:MAG: hypothetical protein RIB03_15860 [Henriciella sp.]|uniref:hypothetical protein n=1 Tax=Henriciella sp. TaxID=1968823 RepID=UPI0032EF0A30
MNCTARLHAVQLLTFAFVALITLRGLVPDGYMIDRSPDTGAIVLRICGGLHENDHSPATAHVSGTNAGHQMHEHHSHGASMPSGEAAPSGMMDGPSDDNPEHGSEGAMCPFALSSLMDSVTAPALPEMVAVRQPMLGGKPYFRPAVRPSARPPMPPRSPPVPV